MISPPDSRAQLPNAFYPFFGQFARLRPAQEKTIPLILSGKNVLLISPTGSGKTEAMVAPVAERATKQQRQLTCLYICPTRALVNDIERRVKDKLARMELAVGVRHGDRKTMQGTRAPEFLITTPESLDVMLGSDRYRPQLETVRTIIVDEVHQFYQTHRGYQLKLLLERLKGWTKAPLQRLLLSATVAQPEEMGRWFQGSDAPFELVQIPGTRRLDVMLSHLTAGSGDEYRTGQSAIVAMRQIVQNHAKVLIFANSRNECNWLTWRLNDRLGVPVLLHYSSLDREYRERVEQRFQKEPRVVCVATSTLELGVDIGDVDAVVMYGAPASVSSFVQRVGRGNRRQDVSRVYGLCREYHIDGTHRGADDDLLLLAALLAAMQDSELERRAPAALYSVLVQQLFSLTSRWNSIIPSVLSKALVAAETEPLLTGPEVRALLDHLTEKGFYRYDARGDEYHKTEKWERVRSSLQLWGNIASQASDKVVEATDDIPISDIPRGQAALGRVILVAGQPRLITEVAGSWARSIELDTANPEFVAYETPGAATPPEVAAKVAELLCAPSFPDLPLKLDESLRSLVRQYRQRFRGFPLDEAIPFEPDGSRYCYYTFGGTWAHVILALLLRWQGYRVAENSLRVVTDRRLADLSFLPAQTSDLQNIVAEHLPAFVRQMALSDHFRWLSTDHQLREVCSLIDLARVAGWFNEIRSKELRPLPDDEG